MKDVCEEVETGSEGYGNTQSDEGNHIEDIPEQVTVEVPETITPESEIQNSSDEEHSRWYHIDTYMLPAKFAYFFQLSKDFSYQPFMLLFLMGTGLTKAEAGLITGLRLIGLILGSPFWGGITDKHKNHRKIFVLLCSTSILLLCSLPIISVFITTAAQNQCPFDMTSQQNDTTKEGQYTSSLFFTMLFINIVASFFDGCTMGLVDAGVVLRIKASTKRKDFGWNRAFGGFGFASGSLISGVVIDNFPTIKVNCFSAIFLVYFVCTVGLLISSFFLFGARGEHSNIEENNSTSNYDNTNNNNTTKKNDGDKMTKILVQTLKKYDVLLFFMTVFIVGVQQSTFVSFTTVTLNELQASSTVQALSFTLAGLSCVVSIALSTRLIQLFRGTWNTIIVCGLSFVVRFLLFASIENPVLAIPISLFQSLGLGLFIAASVHHVKSISPELLTTTMYSIMNAMHFGVGFIFANIVGGQIYQRYGSKVLFTLAAILAAAWCTILIFYRIILHAKTKKTVVGATPTKS